MLLEICHWKLLKRMQHDLQQSKETLFFVDLICNLNVYSFALWYKLSVELQCKRILVKVDVKINLFLF